MRWRRHSGGLSANASYVWGKVIDIGRNGNNNSGTATSVKDAFDLAGEYSISSLDIPHRFVASFSYELPFGKGKRFGQNWNGFLNGLAGGWQVSGTATRQSGSPLSISAAGIRLSFATRRPDRLAGDGSFDDARDRARAGQTWFNTAVFAQPADFILGNAARSYSAIRRDGYRNVRRLILPLLLLILASTANTQSNNPARYDLVIYGGTAAAVTAAVQAKQMGKTVIIVSPDQHLGGLSSGGLGFTDTGNKAVIGGLAREFYHRVYQHYQKPEAWIWERREQFGAKGQGTVALDGENRTMWIFEPHVAEQVFEDFTREYKIPVVRNEWLNRKTGVKKSGASIVSIKTLSGKTYTGKMFIDATYEGDLMAAAGVSYHVGRESKAQYGEQWNGVQTGVLHHRHHFGAVKDKISPYWIPGDPKSGVLPRISTAPPGEYGAADNKLQAYCFRMCLTDHAENRVPFLKPAGYDPKQYELMLRIFQAGWRETYQKFDRIPNHKTDTNNHGPFSTDNIGYNYDYPEASYERRRQIIREHEQYQKGWLYFIANDPRVPKDVQDEFRKWGLAKDEFKDNGAWPHQIYVREARRMVGAYVMTENELLKKRPTPDSVGMGSYGIDSHNIQRYIIGTGKDAYVQNEGDIGVSTNGPYQIAYGSLVPKKGQADNLFVPVAMSSSHIAYGSIRMEPVFMILGQSSATAAVMAIDGKLAVQDVPYAKLRERLLQDKQVLEYSATK